MAAAVLARPCTPFITSSPAGGDASLGIARLRRAAGASCARSILLRPRGLDGGAAETGPGLGQRAASREHGSSTVMARGAHGPDVERNETETVRQGERGGHADREAERQRQRPS